MLSVVIEKIEKIMYNRLSLNSNKKYRAKDTKFALLTTFFLTLFSSGIYSVYLLAYSSDFGAASTTQNPTSIPWIENEAACAKSGRTWSKGKCWDYEHNLLF